MRWVMLVVLCFPAAARAEGFEWGVGLRSTAQASKAFEGDTETSMVGGGLQVRFRFGPRWGLDVALEAMRGKSAGGAYERRSTPLSVTGTYRFDCGGVDFYLLSGIGGMTDKVTYLDVNRMEIEEEVDVAEFHVGAGIEGRLGAFGLGAEVRAMALWRNKEDMASPYDAVPKSAGGGQVNLVATYYF